MPISLPKQVMTTQKEAPQRLIIDCNDAKILSVLKKELRRAKKKYSSISPETRRLLVALILVERATGLLRYQVDATPLKAWLGKEYHRADVAYLSEIVCMLTKTVSHSIIGHQGGSSALTIPKRLQAPEKFIKDVLKAPPQTGEAATIYSNTWSPSDDSDDDSSDEPVADASAPQS